jgi:hypothetical protein
MQEVYGRENRNALAQQLLHILPAMSVPTSRGIPGGQGINDADLGSAAKNSVYIDGFSLGSLERRNQFEFLQEALNFFRVPSLDGTYDNIFISLAAAPGFVQHAIRFSNTRSVA